VTDARETAETLGLDWTSDVPALPPRELLAPLPMQYARRHLVLPLGPARGPLTVALADPLALAPLDDLRFVYERPVRPLVVPAAALRDAIARAYEAAAHDEAAAPAVLRAELDGRLELGDVGLDAFVERPDLLDADDEAPVVRLVNALLADATKARASDIHIEPYERSLAVRFRIDGVLHDVLAPPVRLAAALASRVKVMAGLDVAERRLPQDGRLAVRMAGRDVDVRVSIVPTAFGERVALRLLDRTDAGLALEELGLTPALVARVAPLLRRTHGIVLVTGPTGSGKTTTLYAALRRVSDGSRNVMTIEDPIEYQLPGIAQMQVHPRIGLGFATGLRAILRQDPDVILVGEIRDRETVEIALQAALTGHLVLATLHTNDAPSAMTRLLDMGVEPYLIASSVVAVLAQRLVRRTCAACAGAGCAACRRTGFHGRTGIHELLVVDDAVRARIMSAADASTIRREALAAGMVGLRDDGLAKARAGITSEAEVVRVTQEDA
jgi:general secretion pathway protein E